MSLLTGLPAAEAAAATAAAVVAEAAMVAHTGLQLAAVDAPGGAAKAEAAPQLKVMSMRKVQRE